MIGEYYAAALVTVHALARIVMALTLTVTLMGIQHLNAAVIACAEAERIAVAVIAVATLGLTMIAATACVLT